MHYGQVIYLRYHHVIDPALRFFMISGRPVHGLYFLKNAADLTYFAYRDAYVRVCRFGVRGVYIYLIQLKLKGLTIKSIFILSGVKIAAVSLGYPGFIVTLLSTKCFLFTAVSLAKMLNSSVDSLPFVASKKLTQAEHFVLFSLLEMALFGTLVVQILTVEY